LYECPHRRRDSRRGSRGRRGQSSGRSASATLRPHSMIMRLPLHIHLRWMAALAATFAVTPLAAQSKSHPAGHAAQPAPRSAEAVRPGDDRPALPSRLQSAKVGTILIAHGAGAEWNQQVETIAHTANTGGPLEVSYLMGD